MSQNRIVTLIDMDCFYCQVEERADPSLKGKPVAVVQYNQWKGGGIIAVNYEARNNGVSRGMRGDEALKKCPEIKLVSVPEVRGKADLTRYRNAGREVVAVLCEFSSCVEKASIDEAYIDLTNAVCESKLKVTSEKLENTFVVGYDSKDGIKQWLNDTYNGGISDNTTENLAQAAVLVEEIRAAIQTKTNFHCSAGISCNKVLAKLACGMHKPNRQTVLPLSSVPILYKDLPLKKIRSLGGKFGDAVRDQLQITNMGEVVKFSLKELQQRFGDKSGLWLYNIARGIHLELVKPRLVSKSIGCCKNFKGPDALTTKEDVKHWISELAAEIIDRIQDDLIMNKRKATVLVVSAHQETSVPSAPFSRSIPSNNYDQDEIIRNALNVLNKCNNAVADSPSWSPALKFLGLSVGKFIELKDCGRSLLNFFKPLEKSRADESESESKNTPSEVIEQADVMNTCSLIQEDNERNMSKGSELDSNDYRNSFFCKYFSRKRFPIISAAGSGDKNTNELQTEMRNTHGKGDVGHPIPSSSKCNIEESKPVQSTSNYVDYAVPSTSRDYDMKLDEISKTAEHRVNEVREENCTTDYNALTDVCSECNQIINLVDFLEHLDHHVARKLQDELNAQPVPRTENNVLENSKSKNINNISTTNSSKKLGREKRKYTKSKTRNSPAKRVPLQITTFFKPQVGSTANE